MAREPERARLASREADRKRRRRELIAVGVAGTCWSPSCSRRPNCRRSPAYLAGFQPGRHPALRPELPAARAAAAAGRTQSGQGHLRAPPRSYRLQVPGPPGLRLYRGRAGAERVPAVSSPGAFLHADVDELVQSRVRARARRFARHREGLLSELGQQRGPLRARAGGRGRGQGPACGPSGARSSKASSRKRQQDYNLGTIEVFYGRPQPAADRAQPQDPDRDRRGARFADCSRRRSAATR